MKTNKDKLMLMYEHYYINEKFLTLRRNEEVTKVRNE